MVLYGNDVAIANPNGAEGLVPAAGGLQVSAEYILGGDDTFHKLPSPVTDSQGRFSVPFLQPSKTYYIGIQDRCVTLTTAVLGLENQIITDHLVGSHSGFQPSAAMIAKDDAAAKALGVDVVVLIGTDADACH
jgi:hypothetical protein